MAASHWAADVHSSITLETQVSSLLTSQVSVSIDIILTAVSTTDYRENKLVCARGLRTARIVSTSNPFAVSDRECFDAIVNN